MSIERGLGAIESPWDNRHFRTRYATLGEVEELPTEFYKPLLACAPTSPWSDQGSIGSCTGHDGDINLSILATMYGDTVPELRALKLMLSNVDLSAGWIYHWARHYANVPDYVEGATNLGMLKGLNQKGATTEELCATDVTYPWDGINPAEGAEEVAKDYMISSFWLINPNPNDVKTAIYKKGPNGGPTPLVSAFPWFPSSREALTNGGVVPMPKPGERPLGGHSSPLLGWREVDDGEHYVNFGSWGDDVGNGGLFDIPIGFPFFRNDFWQMWFGKGGPDDTTCPASRAIVKGFNFASKSLSRKTRFKAYVEG